MGQGAIYFTVLTSAGWTTPQRLAQTPRGHQFFPDINADGGVLHAVWHDSRNDPAYSVQYPPGNNGAVRDAAGFAAATIGLDTYAASSRDGGRSWQQARLSGSSQMPNYEMFGDRRVPFHGDYNYVSSVGAFAYNTWTDDRQVGPATTRGTQVAKASTSTSAAHRMPTAPGRPTPAPTPAGSIRTSTARQRRGSTPTSASISRTTPGHVRAATAEAPAVSDFLTNRQRNDPASVVRNNAPLGVRPFRY